MSNNNLVASQDDYVKFKKLLQFFVWQSSRNADNGRAERPTRNKSRESDPNNPEFIERYGLESDFNKMAGLDFIIRFFMVGRFNTELSTYINIELLNIIGKFEKGKIVALRNLIRLDIPSISILGDLRKHCEERNKQLKYYSLKELGIEKDCPSEKISEALKSVKDANDSLKKMFDEYLGIYNDFYEPIKCSIIRKNTKYEDAEQLYKIYKTKDNVLAYYYYGNKLFELAKINKGLFQKAIEKYEKATQLDPKNAYVLNNLGAVLYDLARIDNNKDLFKRALEKYKKVAQLYKTEENKTEENKNKAIAFNNWGNVLYKLAEANNNKILQKEFEIFEKMSKDINDPDTLFIKGELYFIFNKTKEAKECLKKSEKDILEILTFLDEKNRKKLLIQNTDILHSLLESDNKDGKFFKETTKNLTQEQRKKLYEYKKVYINSISIISLLHIKDKNEKFVAHYREKDISQKLLFDDDSKFRLNAINYSNDPSEGKVLLEFLYGKEKCPFDEELNNKEYEAFAGCFTFNYDSLNQFRLYGKEDGKEGTGLSLVFRNNFFSKEAKMAFEPPETDLEKVRNDDTEKNKFSLYRCIYIDPHPKTKQPVVAVGQKEEYLFYREYKGNDFKRYNGKINKIIKCVKKEMKSLKELVNKEKKMNYATIGQLLLNLRYLVKHVAFKEEQECRMINIRPICGEGIEMKPEYKQIYIEYSPKVSSHIDRIYFGPKATGFELFKSILKNRTLNKKITCKKSTNPLA